MAAQNTSERSQITGVKTRTKPDWWCSGVQRVSKMRRYPSQSVLPGWTPDGRHQHGDEHCGELGKVSRSYSSEWAHTPYNYVIGWQSSLARITFPISCRTHDTRKKVSALSGSAPRDEARAHMLSPRCSTTELCHAGGNLGPIPTTVNPGPGWFERTRTSRPPAENRHTKQ